jgi:hypothetical protein
MIQKNISSARTSHVTDTILCLSIRQPYAMWLSNPALFEIAGIPAKTIENREWTTPYRGQILLHASKTFEDGALEYWRRVFPLLPDVMPSTKERYPTGAIVGIADLVDVVWRSNDPWFVGSYGFVLANARPLKPIPYRGQLKFFPVEKSLIEK